MHRSRLTAVLADVPAELYEREVGFWTGALGRDGVADSDDPDYTDLGQVAPGLQFMVQRIGASPRLHLDIETDDVAAEVRRLEALGAKAIANIETWWVMRDPAGLVFCVVRVQNPEAFDAGAHQWP